MKRMIAQECHRNMFKVCIFVSVDVYVSICVVVHECIILCAHGFACMSVLSATVLK